MKVFKPTWTRDGQQEKCRNYYITFTHRGQRRRLPAFPSKRATERAALMLTELLSSTGDLPGEAAKWLQEIPEAMRDKLIAWQVVDKRKCNPTQAAALDELITEYGGYLQVVKGDTPKYVAHALRQLKAVFDGCGFKTPEDIDASEIEAWLIRQRKDGTGYCGFTGWSVRTVNSHITSLRGFMRWVVRKKRALRANPIDAVDTFTSRETDKRRNRRALRTSEIFRLLRKTAEENVIREGMDGAERSLLYEFAIKVGARADAIRHLRACDFDFECEGGATVRLLAEYSKTSTTVVQPLEPALAAKVEKFIQERGRQPEEFVFHGTYRKLTVFTAQIVREDAGAAQVQVETDEGLIDFHALKHTFASSLQGMDDTDKMSLTGHKTRDMLNRYDHRSLESKRALLAKVQAWGVAG